MTIWRLRKWGYQYRWKLAVIVGGFLLSLVAIAWNRVNHWIEDYRLIAIVHEPFREQAWEGEYVIGVPVTFENPALAPLPAYEVGCRIRDGSGSRFRKARMWNQADARLHVVPLASTEPFARSTATGRLKCPGLPANWGAWLWPFRTELDGREPTYSLHLEIESGGAQPPGEYLQLWWFDKDGVQRPLSLFSAEFRHRSNLVAWTSFILLWAPLCMYSAVLIISYVLRREQLLLDSGSQTEALIL